MRIDVAPGERFVLRTAGIFLKNDRVLLHRAEHEDVWALPGGGCEFSEDTQAALVREVEEELGATIRVKSLAFTIKTISSGSRRRWLASISSAPSSSGSGWTPWRAKT